MGNKEAKEMSLSDRAETVVRQDNEIANKKEHLIGLYYYKKGWNDHAQQQQSAFIKLVEGRIERLRVLKSKGDPNSDFDIVCQIRIDDLTELLSKL